jgi:hypothetical protein
MKRTWTALLLALPAVAACSSTDTTAAGIPAEAGASTLSSLDGRLRPFDGRCETALSVTPPLPEDTPNILRLRIEYQCRLGRLGSATAVAEQVVMFTGPATAVASNRTIYTTADGDQLFSTWSGVATIAGPDVAFSGLERFAGGTGRFTKVRGDAWITGSASFITNTGVFTMRGKLNY